MTHISSVVCIIAINRNCLTGSLWLKSFLHNPLCGHPQSDLCYILAATCALLLYYKVHVRGGQQVQIYFQLLINPTIFVFHQGRLKYDEYEVFTYYVWIQKSD